MILVRRKGFLSAYIYFLFTFSFSFSSPCQGKTHLTSPHWASTLLGYKSWLLSSYGRIFLYLEKIMRWILIPWEVKSKINLGRCFPPFALTPWLHVVHTLYKTSAVISETDSLQLADWLSEWKLSADHSQDRRLHASSINTLNLVRILIKTMALVAL